MCATGKNRGAHYCSWQNHYMQAGSIHPALIRDCLANRRAAQRELYDRCLPYLSVIAKRYLRDGENLKDVLQDSFLQLFNKLDQFDASRASFKTWAARIVINNCLKRNSRAEKMPLEALVPETHTVATAPKILEQLDEEALIAWLQQMPTDLHAVFMLHVVDGFSHQEIAEMLSISPALSRKRLSRGRKWLAQQLAEPRSRQQLRRLSFVPLALTLYSFIEQL